MNARDLPRDLGSYGSCVSPKLHRHGRWPVRVCLIAVCGILMPAPIASRGTASEPGEPTAWPVAFEQSAAAAALTPAETARRVAARFMESASFSTTYAVDINLEALLVLGDATGDQAYLEFVRSILSERHGGDPLHVPDWRANPFNFITFDYWMRDPVDAVRPLLVANARAKWQGEVYSPEGALGHRRAPWPAPLLIDALQEHMSRLARAGRVGGEREFYDEAARQWTLYRDILRDPATGLWAHGRGWHESPMTITPWPWGRGHGWLIRGLVEALAAIPPEELAAATLRHGLEELAADLLRYQDSGGMWHQVVDRSDSYPETSGTAAISCYLARAVVQGWLPANPYANASTLAWSGLSRGFVTSEGQVHGTCRGTPPLATLQEYLAREQIVDDHHGTAFVIMAAAGQVFLESGRDVSKPW